MKIKLNYSVEEIAKYNAISVFGSLQELAGIRYPADKIVLCRDAMLKDLQTGAMERSCQEFDRICGEAILTNNN